MVNKRTQFRLLINLLIVIALGVIFLRPVSALAEREHIVYFQNTPYELNIYKIYGRKEGPTMMIVGGIQGDEPGGFLSADLYTDFALKRGNLIVVPRANFNSILLFNRGPNGDMNRKFGAPSKDDYDSRIVAILTDLMSESDLLLNLHDGWGFYRPTYESKIANPKRYGQSIIADCDEYMSPRNGRKLELARMAKQAIELINADIDNSKYHFHFMNTRTSEKDSPYSEQKTSATYFALTRYGIPAFGVETSKNLPNIEMKVHQHNLAINAFMKIFGLEPEQPRIYLEKPQLRYLIVSINNQIPVAVKDGEALKINPGDQIEVIHVEANYDRGLSVDIQGLGTINDFRQIFEIKKPTFIVAQKDHIKFGRVTIALNPPSTSGTRVATAPPATVEPVEKPAVFRVKAFVVELEGRRMEVPVDGQLEAVDGDKLMIVDIITEGPEPKGDLDVNFKGFVADKVNNTGEDRGHVINTATDLMPRYSLSKTEKVYEVVVEYAQKPLARMKVRLKKPRLTFLSLSRNNGPATKLKNGETHKVNIGDKVRVVSLETNVPENQGVQVQVAGNVKTNKDDGVLLAFEIEKKEPIELIVTRQGLTLGKIVLPAS
jgi:protein involved in polysaccharide export with SLBB domain